VQFTEKQLPSLRSPYAPYFCTISWFWCELDPAGIFGQRIGRTVRRGQGYAGRRWHLRSSPATGSRAPLPGGRTATVSILMWRVVTLVLTRKVKRTAGCSAKLVWRMACWWSPIRALVYCTVTATMWVIRINLAATSGVSLKDRLRALVSQRPRRLVSNPRYVSVSDAVG
jgi:hypothetical protein